MDKSSFYIAILGSRSENAIKRHIESVSIFGGSFDGIEVYDTPMDAVCALNKVSKLRPEYHVTIYKSLDTNNFIKVTNKDESRTLILSDMEFVKDQVLALGSIVYIIK